MSNCKTISICNQKGGVGKTTTTVNLGIGLAMRGKKVLLVAMTVIKYNKESIRRYSMADIKTKEVLKGTVKALDKTSVAADRMKHSFIATKERGEKSVNPEEHSAEEYSINRLTENTTTVTRKTVTSLQRAGNKSVKSVVENKKNESIGTVENPTMSRQGMHRFKRKRVDESFVRQSGRSINSTTNVSGNTTNKIKQSAIGKGRGLLRAGKKGVVKQSTRPIKTAKSTSKIAIKITEQSVKTINKTAMMSSRMAKRAFQRSQFVARQVFKATKATVIATIKACKAILAGTKALISGIIAGGWISVIIIVICVLLGSAISLFGDESESSGYVPVSAEVESYTPLITKYAKEYGIPEYVELLKAVMMQESGGRGNDPMQASEGGFNTKYPRQPNAIQDPDYSIRCGVQELKASLESAKVENPIDMERIKLALQGYNFGNGYITWAQENYGGYSYANAVEFSTKQAQKLGWERYGDTQYVSHVLRYYPYGRAFTSGSNQMIIEVALAELGNVGGQPYWSWYGFNSRVEWCACFVSWCANQLGYIESGIILKYASCNAGASWFKNNNQWADRNIEPTAGMIIFFDWDGDGSLDHTGLVEKCENGIVYTIEGNSGDKCRQRTYAVESGEITGYGVPAY